MSYQADSYIIHISSLVVSSPNLESATQHWQFCTSLQNCSKVYWIQNPTTGYWKRFVSPRSPFVDCAPALQPPRHLARHCSSNVPCFGQEWVLRTQCSRTVTPPRLTRSNVGRATMD